MKNLFLYLPTLLFLAFSSKPNEQPPLAPMQLVASTPCDSIVRIWFGLSQTAVIDFIRWDLSLSETDETDKAFALTIQYGAAQANTLGFVKNGKSQSYRGSFSVSKKGDREIYTFTDISQSLHFSLIKLTENLFHLLNTDTKLMVGNGGWSYSLSRKEPIATTNIHLPIQMPPLSILANKDSQVVFDGRTPCQEFAKHYNWSVNSHCFKLKWRLTLNRDAQTFEPSTYHLRKVVSNQLQEVSGKWAIGTSQPENPEAVILQLDPDQPENSIHIWVADENVLFFLDKNKRLLTGNADFSFALNRRRLVK